MPPVVNVVELVDRTIGRDVIDVLLAIGDIGLRRRVPVRVRDDAGDDSLRDRRSGEQETDAISFVETLGQIVLRFKPQIEDGGDKVEERNATEPLIDVIRRVLAAQ
jgi:hypothetical protein